MFRSLLIIILVTMTLIGIGCIHTQPAGMVAISNPIFVPAVDQEFVWERTVDVLHDYHFQIGLENKHDGIIETKYKVGSGILEPWHRDSIGKENRLESTFQSIRRRLFLNLTPVEGGYLLSIEAFKELEDLRGGLAANSAGAATFQENNPLRRDLNLVVGQSRPSGWIPIGRDVILEQNVLSRLQAAFSR